jgi:N-acetylglucosaminyldiphosphoundecaprenol N-acetyl-beta-D-mannosaminyltransferase
MIERNLLGIKLYDTTKELLILALDKFIKKNEKKIVFGISAAAYGRFKFRPDLYGIFNRIDILVAEGAGIPFFARCFGVKITEKIGQVNLMFDLLNLANTHSYKVILFGATDETNKNANEIIASNYPKIKICQGVNGFFNEEDIPQIIDKINTESPDILFIGISYPIKERFAVKYRDAINAKLIIPVGGAFEVLVGNVKRPQKDTKRIPIAWLYRLMQEPIRMFKPILVTVLYSTFFVFPILLFKHITGIERNPSIGKFFKLTGNEWDPEKDPIK